MAISREKKEKLVAEYRELLSGSRGILFSQYSGITVRDMEELRAKIREAGGSFHVVKNSLLTIALEEEGVAAPEGSLEGTTAVGFATEDVPAVAKALVDLAKERDVLRIKSAIVDGTIYGDTKVQRLAELPPLDVVRSQLIGVLLAPGSRVASVLSSSVRQVVNVVNAFAQSEQGA